jgi:hypothetical protein
VVEKVFSLQLDGDTSIELFANALMGWANAMHGAATLVGKQHVVSNYITDLSSGSAITESTVTFDSAEAADRFESLMNDVHLAVKDGTVDELPTQLQRGAARLRKIPQLNGSTSMVLRSRTRDVLVTTEVAASVASLRQQAPQMPSEIFGELIGRLQAVSSRKAFTGTLHDDTFDKAVRCYFDAGQEDLVRDMWDRRVAIVGNIRRDPATGRPLSIRNITSVSSEDIEPDEHVWQQARGILKRALPDELPEVLLRRLRDE